MRARTLFAIGAATTLTLAALPSGASAAPSDIAATHRYITANYALARASVARIGQVQVRIKQFNSRLSQECPRAGAGTPENEQSQPVSHEVAAALWSLSYGTAAGPIAAFARTVKPLRWSNPRITGIALRHVRDLRTLATLPLPKLCEDVRSWTASGFRVVPPAVADLVQRVDAIHPTPIPARLLAPFARGTDAATIARTVRLERKLEEAEFELGQDDWYRVLDTLGLPP